MSERKRTHAGIGLGLAVCMAVVILGIASTSASADDGILVLSSRHLGMTSEEIAENERTGGVETAAPEAAAESEWRSDHVEASGEVCPPMVAAERAVRSFEGCVESAIRAGNGYGESSRVCRALFPERTAAAEEPAAEAEVEAESAVE